MKQLYILLLSSLLLCFACQWHLRSSDASDNKGRITIERYDRLERHFLMSGDVAALQQMNTEYPVQTRTLIEDVLRIGRVDEPDINIRFLSFFQDSTLQALMSDVEQQYVSMSDVEQELTDAFHRLSSMIPTLATPRVYTQIGSLDQSIVVGDGFLGISLDKYLGMDHPVYLRYGYTGKQRAMMKREYIAPDCLSFYLLSLYPFSDGPQADVHMAKIQYVVNKALGKKIFLSEKVKAVEKQMAKQPQTPIDKLLSTN